MEPWAQILLTFTCSIVACSGFWKFLEKRADTKDAQKELLVGLGHDRIMSLGLQYVERGYITKDEYENLNTYLYKPYEKCDGNGSAKRIMKEVETLPIKESKYSHLINDDNVRERRK